MSDTADQRTIKKAYRKLALKFHPDKLGKDATEAEKAEAEQNFAKIGDAHTVLSDVRSGFVFEVPFFVPIPTLVVDDISALRSVNESRGGIF